MNNNHTPEWHRLHPAMLLFQLSGILRRYFLLFVVGGVASSRNQNFVDFVLLSSALTLTVSLLRYFSYRYSLDEKYLTVTEGVFTKKSQRYLLDKINHVNRHQNPLAKMMNIVKLELQQEASNIPALFLPAVTFKQAEEIEQAIQSHSLHGNISTAEPVQQSSDLAPEAERRVLYQGTVKKSLIEGLSSLPVRLLFVGGIFYRFYGRALTPILVDDYGFYVKTLNHFGIDSAHHFWLFIIISAVCVYLIALFVGTAAAYARWFNYRVVEKSNIIFIVSGWFTRSTTIINRQQIQSIVGVANPLRRLFDLCQWQIIAPRPGGQRGRTSQLVPLGKSDEITGLVPSIWDNCVYPGKNWLPVDPYHRRRLWLLTLLTAGIVLVVVAAIDTSFNTIANENLWRRALSASLSEQMTLGIFALLLLTLFRRLVTINYAGTGYQWDENFLFIRTAFLSQSTYVVPQEKIQAVIFKRSLMQLRRGLVTIELDINGILRPVRLYNVPDDFAEQVRSKVINCVNKHNN